MPVPKKRIPKWAYVRESEQIYIDGHTLADVVETFDRFPTEATLHIDLVSSYYDETDVTVKVVWRRVMTDGEYDKEFARRKANRELKIKRETEHRAKIEAEAKRLGLI